jgi:hypothetical protein
MRNCSGGRPLNSVVSWHMSSVVTISRKNGNPLSYEEFVKIAKSDPEFVADPKSAQLETPSFIWKPTAPSAPTYFHFWRPEVAVESPSPDALRKMVAVASSLDAELRDESGEVIDIANVASAEAVYHHNAKVGLVAMALILGVIIGVLVWVLR